jgi:hypothetical protein
MTSSRSRRLLGLYALFMLVIAFGYARYDGYLMDGDGTAFLDISQALTDGHAGLAINGYWNPGYPAVLAAVRIAVHPTRWTEMAMARYTNVAIFGLAILACLFFTAGLVRLRAQRGPGEPGAAVPDWALHLLGLALLTMSAGRELPLTAVRSDTLLMVLLLLAMGLGLRLQAGSGFWAWPVLGATLGCAYLVKSFAFLPSLFLLLAVLIFGLTRKGSERTKIVSGAVVTGIVFAAIAGPYVVAISRQLGHLSTGDSARLNYCYFIDQTPRWHEWYLHDLGHAVGTFTHPEAVIAAPPPVFSFAAHPVGTFPLWFDPAYWTVGLTPHFWLKGHVERLIRCTELFVRYLLGRPEAFVLLGVMLAFGAIWPRRRASLVGGSAVLWGLLMLGIYFPIDLQERYLMAPFLFVLLPLFAWLQRREGNEGERVRWIAGALVVSFAGIAAMQAVSYLAECRRLEPSAHRGEAGYNPEMNPMAEALDAMGLKSGDRIACFGDTACYLDHQWARLAGAQIMAEVETPNNADPQQVWDSIPDKRSVTEPLQKMGLRFIVTKFANSARKPEGWVQLGDSDFFAYPLTDASR